MGLLPALIALALLVLVVVVVVFKDRLDLSTASARELPYAKVDSLLTPAERSFYGVLREVAEASGFDLFVKVRLADLVFVPRGTTNWRTYQNRIQQKHVDFVLCDRLTVAPVLVAELDDSSHNRSDRRERDAQVDGILERCGLPIIRVAARRSYMRNELAQAIAAKLGSAPPAAPIAPQNAPTNDLTPRSTMMTVEPTEDGPSVPVIGNVCPRCGSVLVERMGRQTRERFWGCQSYPSCRYTRPFVGP